MSHDPKYDVAEFGEPKPVYGLCLACRSVEVELVDVIGTRDLSYMGESPHYPIGYGCEACA